MSSTALRALALVCAIPIIVWQAVELGAPGSGPQAASHAVPALGNWRDAEPQIRDELVTAIQAAQQAQAEAARTFDLAGIRKRFADDARVALTERQRETLARFAPASQPNGLLTFKLAYFEHWSVGAAAAERVFAAQQAGRSPDPKGRAGSHSAPRRSDRDLSGVAARRAGDRPVSVRGGGIGTGVHPDDAAS